MNTCRNVIWALVLLVSCASSPDFDDIERSIGHCVDELAANESINTEGGRLIEAWPIAHVLRYSEGQVLHIFFKHSSPSGLLTEDTIDDRIGIICALDGTRTVISLISPERRNNRLVVQEYVLDNQMIQDAAYEMIADALGNKRAVYRFESYYSLDGRRVEPIGTASKVRVLPQEFGME